MERAAGKGCDASGGEGMRCEGRGVESRVG